MIEKYNGNTKSIIVILSKILLITDLFSISYEGISFFILIEREKDLIQCLLRINTFCEISAIFFFFRHVVNFRILGMRVHVTHAVRYARGPAG